MWSDEARQAAAEARSKAGNRPAGSGLPFGVRSDFKAQSQMKPDRDPKSGGAALVAQFRGAAGAAAIAQQHGIQTSHLARGK